MNNILQKLAKIKAQAESARKIGNTEEAAAFAGKLHELLLKHKLSLSDVEYVKLENEESIKEFRIDWDEHGVPFRRRRNPWQQELAHGVAYYHGCQILVCPGTNIISLVGRESNCRVAEYSIGILVNAAIRLVEERYKIINQLSGGVATMRGFRATFLYTFVRTIRARLKTDLEAKVAAPNASTALVRVKNEHQEIDDWMNGIGDIKKAAKLQNGLKEINRAGYIEGKKAGMAVDIHGRAIDDAKQAGQLERAAL